MMDTTPTGMTLARKTGLRQSNAGPRIAWAAITVVVVFSVTMLGPGAGVASADDTEAEQAIIAPLASKSLMLDVAAVDGKLVAVGERGHILISSDGGESWRQVAVPTRKMLTGVDFVGENLGFAVGHDSVILRTADGGETWETVYSAPEDEAPLFDVWFADAENGIAIGAYGSLFRTTDGGDTWDFEPLDDADWHLHEIARADDGRLFMAAEAGRVYRSDDDGETWTELPAPYEGSFFGVLPLAGDTVLIFGLRGHLFRSEDAGETWTPIDTATVAMLNSGARLADGGVLVAGLGGTVLLSTDEGRSFSLYQQKARRGISSVVETPGGRLVMVGEFGVRVATVAELTTAAE